MCKGTGVETEMFKEFEKIARMPTSDVMKVKMGFDLDDIPFYGRSV